MENKLTSRKKMHLIAMQCIFEYLFYKKYKSENIKKSIEEIIVDNTEIPFDECDDFFKAIIFETIQNKDEIIGIIQEYLAKTWKFERLDLVDQAILLLFASEILNKKVEVQVAINEAVELAKSYCKDKSYRYINAVLDKISKQYV